MGTKENVISDAEIESVHSSLSVESKRHIVEWAMMRYAFGQFPPPVCMELLSAHGFVSPGPGNTWMGLTGKAYEYLDEIKGSDLTGLLRNRPRPMKEE